MQGNGIHTMMHILVGILFFATLVGILARKMRFPYHCGSGADAAAARAGLRQLKAMLAEGRISEYVSDIIETQTTDTARLLKEAVQKSVSADSEIAAFERDAAWGETLRVQRIELQNLLTAGLISEETYRELVHVVDTSFENPPSLPETERQKGNSHRTDTKDAKGAKDLIT